MKKRKTETMNCLMCRFITEKISQQQLRHFFIVPSISVFKTDMLLILNNENDEVKSLSGILSSKSILQIQIPKLQNGISKMPYNILQPT